MAEIQLPADIAAAIRQLESAAWVDGNIETEGASQGRKAARAALNAVILRHLSGADPEGTGRTEDA